MRTIFTLVLLGVLPVIRAQENSGSSIATNSAVVVTQPRIIKPLKSNSVIDPERRTAPKTVQPKNARHAALSLSADVNGQRFGAYDRTVITAVQNHWFDLLDNIKYDGYSTGKVVLQFQLSYDGRINELKLAGRTVGETLGLLCQKAVLDSSPFPRWPKEMRKQVAVDSRTMTLTFHYLPDDALRKK